MNYPEFLDLVVQLVSKNAKPSTGLITAAALGGLLRQAAPDVSWKEFGKRSLLQVLQDLEASGRVVLGVTEKEALAVSIPPLAQGVHTPQVAIFNPLRKAIWEAFVLATPAGRRFIHRSNGMIRAGLEMAPAPVDEWVEISPISEALQKRWAQEFLDAQGEGALEGARAYLATPSWHAQRFAQLLREEDDSAARNWNRFRSSRVSAEIQEWFSATGLPVEWAFQQHSLAPMVAGGGEALQIKALSGEESRRAILAALAELPIEKLLEIPIPAGILLAAISSVKAR